MKYRICIIFLILMLSWSMPSYQQEQPKKPAMTVSPSHMIVHPGDTVSFTVNVERTEGGTTVCEGTVYLDLAHPSARGLDYITFLQWQSDKFSLHEVGEARQFEFIIRFKQDAPEGRYVVPITLKGEVKACPDAIPFELTEFITFEVIREPSNVSLKAWFANPCNVCVIPDSTGKAKPGTTFTYPHRICNLGTEQDTFTIETESSEDWKITVYWDQNNNKVLDSTETRVVTSTDLLAPEECFPVILALEVPSSALEGTVDTTIITARSTSRECSDSATDTTTVTTGTPRTTPGLFECAEFEAETFVLQLGSCYINNCVPYKIPVLIRAQVTNHGPTEISNVKIVVEPEKFTIDGLLPQYYVADKMVAEESQTVDIEGYFTSLPPLGSYVVAITLYYIDHYGDEQKLQEQLLVKMEDTAKNYFDQGEGAYKSGDYETALTMFQQAKEMYLSGNFDAMVTETNRYIKLIKASQYFDEAMNLLQEGKVEEAFALLNLAKGLYEELEELRMAALIKKIMSEDEGTGTGEGGISRVIRGTSEGGRLTWIDIFLMVIIGGLVVYIFMRRPR
ncbi:MAG: tetratricopeptide repeat protein [Theionarchaea archaeon]|nr:tetratricopeptide repeat protein [Theionarchaea archaeon]